MDDVSQPTAHAPGTRLFADLRAMLGRPVAAIPLDIFRILCGILLFAYFLRTLLEVPDFASPDGLIDHGLSLSVYWFTKIGLFHPGISAGAFQAIFAFACVCSLLVAAGYRPKLFAFLLFLIAVSTYRWNFMVMYVDDAIMHLIIFWLLVLPVGRTLVIADWIRGRVSRADWLSVTVPGLALRCFFWNLALLYLVAGLWKWTSPMWLDGTAMYVIFKLPISYGADFWNASHIPYLRLLDYCALVFEPVFPIIFLLRRGHFLKYILLIGLIGLHAGTIATLNIPFANFACLAAAVLIFGEEIMSLLGRHRPGSASRAAKPQYVLADAAAVFVTATLTLAMLSSVALPNWRRPTRVSAGPHIAAPAPAGERRGEFDEGWHEGLGPVQSTFFGALWLAGIAQQYQLFNWIDERNYRLHYKVLERNPDGTSAERSSADLIPRSLRGVLLQFYLHGITWMRVPPARQAEIRTSLQTRIAARYCRKAAPAGQIDVFYALERIDPTGRPPDLQDQLLMSFTCADGVPEVIYREVQP
ncbi:MAG: hypothetical protein K1X36_11270 [Pyrinomonadaceae bacterium]|nr:hypothetical protein [Pyrinomonadaceae bacterium]